ncbi:CaiB/BaiF CoA transferase family protein [Mesorhizobium australafricanum]|uniref:CoA transferase n=1 Tax=Mesorhizobium australafricanum TaxID=3072311 RepID=A0ABU4X697_9HYPH|nr:CoA transferase [Mesorhizobium sp. VK3E]MDX8443584.1 CoA transferase [Mesorhizobium sp. VK3E]
MNRSGPLEGIRVVDFSGYIAGPFCTQMLGDMGADVIKVEPPTGEQWRGQDPFAPGFSRSFIALNRNKRSIVLDLKSGEGREVAMALVASADVMVHNYRPGVPERLGIGYDAMRALNPKLIYASNSAYGQEGPRAHQPGYDLVIQAVSGLIASNPTPDGKAPRRYAGIALIDFTAGQMLAIAVLSALIQRQRTGVGQKVESTLIEAALSLQRQKLVSIEGLDGQSPQKAPGTVLERMQRSAGQMTDLSERELYYRTYETSDGYVTIGCLNVPQRKHFMAIVGLEDPWFENPDALPKSEDENRRRRALTSYAEAEFRKTTTAAWVRKFEACGVPCAPVQMSADLMFDEQVEAGGYFVDFMMPEFGRVRTMGTGISVNGRPESYRPPPKLGQHTQEILAELAVLQPAATSRMEDECREHKHG